MYTTIDGHEFKTIDGAESYYLANKQTHTGQWNICIEKENEVIFEGEVSPDFDESNIFRLVHDYISDKVLQNDFGGKYDPYILFENDQIIRKQYINEIFDTPIHEPSNINIQSCYTNDDLIKMSYDCAQYDHDNGDDRDVDEIYQEYLDMPSSVLIYDYTEKYDQDYYIAKHDNLMSFVEDDYAHEILSGYNKNYIKKKKQVYNLRKRPFVRKLELNK